MPDRNPVEVLADEFAARYRGGERPSVAEYTARYPDHAAEIEELFPSIVMIEQLKQKQETDLESVQRQSRFAGKKLDRLGDYEIVREIGRGGMGVVFEAFQGSLGRRVALKVLSESAMASEKQIKRFEREARAAAALHHTNIVPVFGVGHEDNLHFYVMQFIEGVGLDEVLGALRRVAIEQEETQAGSAVVLAHALRCGSFAGPRKLGSSSGMSLARETVDAEATNETLTTPERRPPAAPLAATGAAAPSESNSNAATPAGPGVPRLDETTDRELAAGQPHADNGDALEARRGKPSASFGARYFKSIARIGLQVADALQYAHGQQVLHRDIKPGNLLLDAQGTVWVTDFGLAKVTEQQDLTRTGDIVGTLRYMAPEQFDGKSDARSDIYSLGLTLYELLTLQPAFDDTAIKQLLDHRSSDRLIRPRSINPDIPADLETIVLKTITADPHHRYVSAEALAEDLQRFLDDRPILARRATPAERVWRWSRRNPALAALSGTALALGLALLGLLSVGYHRAESKRQEVEEQKREADRHLNLAFVAFDNILENLGSRGVPMAFDVGSGDESAGEQVLYYETEPTTADADLLYELLRIYGTLGQSSEVDDRSARAYHRIGDIHQRLKNRRQAVDAYMRALQHYERFAVIAPAETAHVISQAEVLNELANTEKLFGRLREAGEYHDKALAVLAGAGEMAEDPRIRFARAQTYLQMVPRTSLGGWRSRSRGTRSRGRSRDSGDAGNRESTAADGPPRTRGGRPSGYRSRWIPLLEEAERLLQELLAQNSQSTSYRFALARCYQGQLRLARPGSADAPCQQAVGLLEQLIAEDADDPRYRFELAETLKLACTLPDYRGNRIGQLEKASDIAQGLVQQFSGEPTYEALLSSCYAQEALFWQHDWPARADQRFRESYRLKASLVARFPSVMRYKLDLDRFARGYVPFLFSHGELTRAAEVEDAVMDVQAEVGEFRERFSRQRRSRPQTAAPADE